MGQSIKKGLILHPRALTWSLLNPPFQVMIDPGDWVGMNPKLMKSPILYMDMNKHAEVSSKARPDICLYTGKALFYIV